MKTWHKILIIVILLGIGIFALFYFFNKIAVPVPIEESQGVLFPGFEKNGGTQGLGDVGSPSTEKTAVLSKISDVPVFDFWISKDTGELYYITNKGRIFSGKDGSDIDMNTQELSSLNMIIPSETGKKIIASFGDPQKPRWGVFDVVDGVWKPLSDKITSATWGKDEDTLIGTIQNEDGHSIAFFDISKNPVKSSVILKDFRIKDVSFSWKNPDSIMILERSSATIKGRLWEFNTKNLLVKQVDPGTSGLSFLWSASREYALRFSNPNNLLVLNGNLEPVNPLTVTSIPQKCGFSEDALYCFIPQDTDSFLEFSLPDDYFQNKFYSTDTLISINLETDKMETLLQSGAGNFSPIDGRHPRVHEGDVFFVNKYDWFVYRVHISEEGEGLEKSNEVNQNEENQIYNEPSPFN